MEKRLQLLEAAPAAIQQDPQFMTELNKWREQKARLSHSPDPQTSPVQEFSPSDNLIAAVELD